jgi:hypothetical protein
MQCADCEKEILIGEPSVAVADDFIVHQTCLDAVEKEWTQTKIELRKMHFDATDCGWRERYDLDPEGQLRHKPDEH